MSFLVNSAVKNCSNFTSLAGEETESKSDAFRSSGYKAGCHYPG